jgi:CDP-diacylglycerol--serine O-phosphatidyltransferase
MRPRFVGCLGIADVVTAANAGLGFVAVFAATVDPELAARLVLLAAIADGLDGLLARRYGSTPAGEHLDSLADVASFSVAPAFLVATLASEAWGYDGLRSIAAVAVGALFVAAGVVRLGMYTAYDTGNAHTEGVPTTLAATLLAAGVLAGVSDPAIVVTVAAVLTLLMVSPVTYPDLYPRDALAMGVVQAAAVLVPLAFSRLFPRALLAWALAYLALAPRFYWRTEGKRS